MRSNDGEAKATALARVETCDATASKFSFDLFMSKGDVIGVTKCAQILSHHGSYLRRSTACSGEFIEIDKNHVGRRSRILTIRTGWIFRAGQVIESMLLSLDAGLSTAIRKQRNLWCLKPTNSHYSDDYIDSPDKRSPRLTLRIFLISVD